MTEGRRNWNRCTNYERCQSEARSWSARLCKNCHAADMRQRRAYEREQLKRSTVLVARSDRELEADRTWAKLSVESKEFVLILAEIGR
jgi:hypothetical protein